MTDRSHSRSRGHEQGRSQWNSTLGTSLITLTHHNICSPESYSPQYQPCFSRYLVLIGIMSANVYFSVCLSVCLSFCLSVFLSICLSANFLNDFLCFLMTFSMGSLRLFVSFLDPFFSSFWSLNQWEQVSYLKINGWHCILQYNPVIHSLSYDQSHNSPFPSETREYGSVSCWWGIIKINIAGVGDVRVSKDKFNTSVELAKYFDDRIIADLFSLRGTC